MQQLARETRTQREPSATAAESLSLSSKLDKLAGLDYCGHVSDEDRCAHTDRNAVPFHESAGLTGVSFVKVKQWTSPCPSATRLTPPWIFFVRDRVRNTFIRKFDDEFWRIIRASDWNTIQTSRLKLEDFVSLVLLGHQRPERPCWTWVFLILLISATSRFEFSKLQIASNKEKHSVFLQYYFDSTFPFRPDIATRGLILVILLIFLNSVQLRTDYKLTIFANNLSDVKLYWVIWKIIPVFFIWLWIIDCGIHT